MNPNKTILTVTLNPAIDRLVDVSGFRVEEDNRCSGGTSFAGGKGINVSRALRALGLKSVTAGFAGGANGQNLLRDLLLEGLEHNFVFIQGETRLNLTVRDAKNGKITRVIDAGPSINLKDLSSFRDKFKRLAKTNHWVVLSGRNIEGTPQHFYQELVATARKERAKVILDVSGNDLKIAIKAKPFLLKINGKEAEFIVKKPLRVTLKKLLDLGAENVIISLGDKGAVATDGKVFYEVTCPKVKAVNAVGCGDAMTAGFIYGYTPGEDFLEGLVSGVAAGTASCLIAKPGELKAVDFKRIISKVRVKVL